MLLKTIHGRPVDLFAILNRLRHVTNNIKHILRAHLPLTKSSSRFKSSISTNSSQNERRNRSYKQKDALNSSDDAYPSSEKEHLTTDDRRVPIGRRSSRHDNLQIKFHRHHVQNTFSANT
jgi:hypothetical protein